MHVFVTGGTGHSGSHIVPDLVNAGHRVTGLARSDASAVALTALGAEVRRGDLDDLDTLREAAAESDGVIHVAHRRRALYCANNSTPQLTGQLEVAGFGAWSGRASGGRAGVGRRRP